MGPEVGELEIALSSFCGAQHALTCSNGTDALGLILMALELGATDAVLCPSFTFAATAEAVAWFGATPVFVDVDEHTFNMDPASLEAGIGSAKGQGLTPVGVISVDLFGQPADYDRLEFDLRGAPPVALERCRTKLRCNVQRAQGGHDRDRNGH